MKIHYFQRYHQGEDVATANTMLLLSRLYQYSPDKFYLFLQSICALNAVWDFNPGLSFNLQQNAPKSRLDAVIVQQSFKVAVETKLSDWFHADQIQNHLEVFWRRAVQGADDFGTSPYGNGQDEGCRQGNRGALGRKRV